MKERDVTPYLGHIPDNLYSTVTTTITSSVKPLVNDEWLLAQYNTYSALRSTKIGTSAYAGHEKLDGYKGKDKFNKCVHTKHQGFNVPWAVVWEGTLPSYNWVCRNYYRIGFPASLDARTDLYVPPLIDQIRSRAWANLQPEFGGEFSLLNFLLELKDFKDVAHTLYHYRGSLFNVYKALRRFERKHKNDPVFDPSIPMSTFLLTYNLAIKPLIKDIQEILGMFGKVVMDAQVEFQKLGLTKQTSYYTEVVDVLDTRKSPTYGDYFWQWSGDYKRTIFTATLQYNYDYEMRNIFDAFQKYWGLSGSFEALWNYIPFSFLLDYVVKIGDAIRAAERDLNVDLKPIMYGESLKTIYSRGVHFKSHSRFRHCVYNGNVVETGASLSNRLISGTEGKVYFRYPSTPFKGMVVPKLRKPTSMQMLNTLALARLAFS